MYQAIVGSGWPNNTKWCSTDPVCASGFHPAPILGVQLAPVDPAYAPWHGIKCEDNKVTSLQLKDSQLWGSIPDSVVRLSMLTRLILSGLCSFLSPLCFLLSSVCFPLSPLCFVFSALCFLPSVVCCLLAVVCSFLFSFLSVFCLLTFSFFFSLIPLLYSRCRMSLILSGVDKDHFSGLSGTVPSKFGELKRLRALGIQFTQVSGVIPDTLCQLTELEGFNFQRGIISGTISESLGGWRLCLFLAFSPFNHHGHISLSVFFCLCLRLYSLSLHSISEQSSISFYMSLCLNVYCTSSLLFVPICADVDLNLAWSQVLFLTSPGLP